MCGIFFLYSNEYAVIERMLENEDRIIAPLIRRGPDKLGRIVEPRFVAAHTLLSITGYYEQPVHVDPYVILFNGEIYNDYAAYTEQYGDTEYLTDFIRQQGLDDFRPIDGEYAVVVYDQQANAVSLFTDPFATKPLYYQLTDNAFAVATFESIVRGCELGRGVIRKVPANTAVRIDLNRFQVTGFQSIFDFDFSTPKNESYDTWIEAFRASLIKRCSNTRHGLFLPMSSGHDSGVIAAELAELGLPFRVYTVLDGEDTTILRDRIEYLEKRQVSCEIMHLEQDECLAMRDYLMETMEAFMLENPATPGGEFPNPDFRCNGGVVAHSMICRRARPRDELIGLYGNGGDEIYCDFFYGPNHNISWSHVLGDWRSMAGPWPNFFGGWNSVFLGAADRICSHFSVEGRLPLLDRFAVQQFLNLSPALKSRYRKAPLEHRMQELGFPCQDRKFGFSGADAHLKKAKFAVSSR